MRGDPKCATLEHMFEEVNAAHIAAEAVPESSLAPLGGKRGRSFAAVASLAGLNAQQEAVARFDGGPLRVLAGAGTGKTTALTGRVAALIDSGVVPERVLLLTFTRRAAAAMLTRTTALLSRGGRHRARVPGKVIGGTFHSVAHRTLRRHSAQLGLPAGFSVLDPSDSADLIDMIRDDVVSGNAAKRRFPRKATLIDLYSRAVNTDAALGDVIRGNAPWCLELLEPIAEICRSYVCRKQRLGLLDFDDLLLYWRQALRDDVVGRQLADAFDHVLVDEYQDVNSLQVELLQLLRRSDRRITVVGDDAQAIYGFRSADPRHILEFDSAFPDAVTLSLTANYRSSAEIISVANAVAADAMTGFSTRLVPAGQCVSRGRLPRIFRCGDEQAQSVTVCDEVLASREAGTMLKQQAILVRAAHHTGHLELELGRRAIPFVKYGGLRYLEAAHVKDLLAAFRLADNPRDQISWFRLLQLLAGVGPVGARKAVTALGLESDGDDAEVLLRWPLAAACLPASAQANADRLASALVAKPGEAATNRAQRLRDALAPMITDIYDDHEARLTDLDALVDATANVTRLADVAADQALDPPRSTGTLAGPPTIDDDWLILSTVHSAKGLEWDIVHVLHAADGNFPSDMALTSLAGLEEERRLFYVAVTRPRRQLNVFVPLRYHHHPSARNDRHSWAQPSRFLSDGVQAQFDTVTVVDQHSLSTEITRSVAVADGVSASLAGLWS